MPKAETGFRGISLKTELVNEIEEFIKGKSYKSVSDFVHEATRWRMEEIKKINALPFPILKHFNLDLDGVKIHDSLIHEYVNVAFKPQGMLCDHCETNDCYHIKFALTVPAIQEVIRKHVKDGWNLPEV